LLAASALHHPIRGEDYSRHPALRPSGQLTLFKFAPGEFVPPGILPYALRAS